jgi:uncharacterized protein YggE
VKINKLDLLDESIIILSKNKPDNISDIDYSLQAIDKHKINLLEKATINACEKADKIVIQMGVKLGDILYVEEIPEEVVNLVGGISTAKDNKAFYLPRIKLRTKIKTIFEIVKNIN